MNRLRLGRDAGSGPHGKVARTPGATNTSFRRSSSRVAPSRPRPRIPRASNSSSKHAQGGTVTSLAFVSHPIRERLYRVVTSVMLLASLAHEPHIALCAKTSLLRMPFSTPDCYISRRRAREDLAKDASEKAYFAQLSTGGGTRTHTRLPSTDFESVASTIPPLRRGERR